MNVFIYPRNTYFRVISFVMFIGKNMYHDVDVYFLCFGKSNFEYMYMRSCCMNKFCKN